MEAREIDLRNITQSVLKTYQDEMHNYLSDKPAGSLTDADVILMIMNLTISVSTNIYYSLKQILPTTTMDFDYMRAKITNSLVDSFEKIKEFIPKENVMPLSVEQLEDIKTNGFTIIKMPDGSERKVSKEDLLVKKEEKENLIKVALKGSIKAPSEKKIILRGEQ